MLLQYPEEGAGVQLEVLVPWMSVGISGGGGFPARGITIIGVFGGRIARRHSILDKLLAERKVASLVFSFSGLQVAYAREDLSDVPQFSKCCRDF